MKALDLYEPLFLYLCRLNRLGRNGAPLSYGEVRNEIERILKDIEHQAAADIHLREHYRHLDPPMLYAIDDIIRQGPFQFKERWHDNSLGFAKYGLAGDEAFFDHLDAALKETPSEALAERLLCYYVCLGLGFEGFYFNDKERLLQYQQALYPAIKQWLVEDRVDHLVPQCYQYTNARDFTKPPAMNKAVLLAGICALLLCGIPIYAYLAHSIERKVDQQIHLREINESFQGAPWQH